MKVLLLGATGYLGGNIAYRLVEAGHDVTCVVRSTSDTSRLEKLNVQVISNDLNEIEIFFKFNKVDWVINGVCTYKTNGTLYGDLLISNLIFPLSVLNLAVKYKVDGFITMGTSLPKGLNHYSYTKGQFAEFGRFLSERDGIKFADLNLEMFYGGLFEPTDRFISSCREKLIRNERISLTKGVQKRDMVRVEDVVGIISSLIDSDHLQGFMALPVGSGESHSIREVIEYMKAELGSGSVLDFGAIPSRAGEPDTLADISWYRDIGYELKYRFYDGLKEECKIHRIDS